MRPASYAESMIKSAVRIYYVLPLSGFDARAAQTTGTSASTAPKLDTDEQKTLYALDLLLGRNIKPFALTQEELAIVNAGLKDAVLGAKPQVELDTYGPKVNELAQKRAAIGAEDEKKKKKQTSSRQSRKRSQRDKDAVWSHDLNDHSWNKQDQSISHRRCQSSLRRQASSSMALSSTVRSSEANLPSSL